MLLLDARQSSDKPLEDPKQDLLGTDPYARQLAQFVARVKPPFTIGIRGKWGSGKTTFVQFVKWYLEHSAPVPPDAAIRFIEFPAWPHRTSDELWRGLIYTIAKALYGDRSDPNEKARNEKPAQSGLFPWLTEFLSTDLLVFRKPSPPPDPDEDYWDLLSQLDKAPFGSISKSPESLQFDRQEAVLAGIKTALAAMGSISPLLAGIRGLLGSSADVNPAALVQRTATPTVGERLKSIDDFKRAFATLFEKKACNQRVVVFVDDLDRCLPDTALELLEAIKIFLGEVKCIFLIAADEDLIGQALTLRLRELYGKTELSPQQVADRGSEYLEKIIQLRIPVPPPSDEQVAHFISANYPHWTSIIDIVQAAFGINRRRILQYCSWLSYKYDVESLDGANRTFQIPPLFNKMLAIRTWNPNVPRLISELTDDSDTFAASMTSVERSAEQLSRGYPLSQVESDVISPGARGLMEHVAESAPLTRLFSSAPRFSEKTADVVAAYAELSDVHPHPETILETNDLAFMRMLSQLKAGGMREIDDLMRNDFARLVRMHQRDPELTDRVLAVLDEPNWREALTDMEGRELAVVSVKPVPVEYSAALASLVAGSLAPAGLADPAAAETGLQTATESAQSALVERPRPSELLHEELVAFRRVRQFLPAAQGTPANGAPNAPEEHLGKIAESILSEHLRDSERESIRTAVQERVTVARRTLELRKFAKLDALEHQWPTLYRAFDEDRLAFERLEKQLLTGQEAELIPEQYAADSKLRRFLGLRPLFSDIFSDELKDYQALSKAVVSPAAGAAAADLGPLATVSQTSGSVAPQPTYAPRVLEPLLLTITSEPPAAPGAEQDDLAEFEYALHRLAAAATRNERLSSDERGSVESATSAAFYEISQVRQYGKASDPQYSIDNLEHSAKLVFNTSFRELLGTREYSVALKAANSSTPLAEARITLDWNDVDRRFAGIYQSNTRASGVPSTGAFRDLRPASRDRDATSLRDLGRNVYELFFQGELADRFIAELNSRPSMRLLVQASDHPRVMSLPWEALYIHSQRLFLNLSQKYSVARHVQVERPRPQRSIMHPLRILAVLASPSDLPALNIAGERQLLERTLQEARDAKDVVLDFVYGPDATPDQVREAVRRLRPHVVHFVGHGAFSREDSQGALMLCRESDSTHFVVPASKVAQLLENEDMALAVLNACDTGTSSNFDPLSGVASALINAGANSVIATTRSIDDSAALLFAREFYRSFIENYGTEAALTEARKHLNIESYDWAAYAMYTDERNVDVLRAVT
jgi:hypothetical protein